jgi:hypothetical protein
MKYLSVLCLMTVSVSAQAREPSIPIPPIPPAEPPFQAAPLPNPNIQYPDHDAQRYSVTLDSGINHREAPDPGVAFAPGAHYQLDNDRRPFVLPGIMVHLPVP